MEKECVFRFCQELLGVEKERETPDPMIYKARNTPFTILPRLP